MTVREALDRAAGKINQRFQDRPLVEAAIRMAIADAYQSLGADQATVPHLERAVALRQFHLGLGHKDTLASIHRLANSYSFVARYHDAIALNQQLVADRMARLGPDHPETLVCLSKLAEAFAMNNDLDKSGPLYEQLLVKRRSTLGPTHPETLGTMHRVAMNYASVGRLAESLALHEALLDHLRSTFGPEHESTCWPMMTYAGACQQAGNLDRADQLLREVLQHIEKRESSGRWRQTRARVLAKLARNLLLMQRHVEAEPLAREAMEIYAREQPDKPGRFSYASLLGEVLLGQQKYREAEPLLLKGYEGIKNRAATHHIGKPMLAEAVDRIVRFYEATNQPVLAAKWREELEGGNARTETRSR